MPTKIQTDRAQQYRPASIKDCILPVRLQKMAAVSYTHLDVYKRQSKLEARSWRPLDDFGEDHEAAEHVEPAGVLAD